MKNFRNACLPAALAILMSGCGGGGGSDGSPAAPAPGAASITVAPDSKTVHWNTASTIDVIANDSASRGVLTLTGASGAEHGSAAVANGKIVYTPTAGFYGVDKFTYTVSGEGGASAKGEAVVTVEAVMTLTGNASDAPLAGAAVTARIGERSVTTSANANGDYTLNVRSSAPTEFITLVASGVGAQAHVKLTSLVGDIATLAKSAGAQGQVGMAQAPALGVTHITTAFTALATKAQGSAPASAQQLADAGKQVDFDEVMRIATAIKLSADQGVALPAGVPDTMALAASTTAVDAVYAAAGSTLAAATRTLVETETNVPSAAFTLGGLAERTMVYNTFTVTYRANGTGRMSGRMGERDITWVADGATVRLTYASPTIWEYEPYQIAINGTTSPYALLEKSTGMIIQSVVNDSTVKWGETGSVTYTSGPDTGKLVTGANLTTTNTPYSLSRVFNLDQRLPIAPALMAPGVTLVGFYNNPMPVMDTTLSPGSVFLGYVPKTNDLLEFTSATDARFLAQERNVKWSVSDNYLLIEAGANSVTWKVALLRNATSGQQHWVAMNNDIAVPFVTTLADVPRPRFTDELVLRNWTVGYGAMYGQPQSDKTMISQQYPSSAYTGSWSVTDTGALDIRYVNKTNGNVISNRYIPIRWVGKKLSVKIVGKSAISSTEFELGD